MKRLQSFFAAFWDFFPFLLLTYVAAAVAISIPVTFIEFSPLDISAHFWEILLWEFVLLDLYAFFLLLAYTDSEEPTREEV